MKRKTTQERIEAHRAKADALERKARLRALRMSPEWVATRNAIVQIDSAMLTLTIKNASETEHARVLCEAVALLNRYERDTFGEVRP